MASPWNLAGEPRVAEAGAACGTRASGGLASGTHFIWQVQEMHEDRVPVPCPSALSTDVYKDICFPGWTELVIQCGVEAATGIQPVRALGPAVQCNFIHSCSASDTSLLLCSQAEETQAIAASPLHPQVFLLSRTSQCAHLHGTKSARDSWGT